MSLQLKSFFFIVTSIVYGTNPEKITYRIKSSSNGLQDFR